MLENNHSLEAGSRIYDHMRNRILVLETLINPMGKTIPSYWKVRNEQSNRKSVIRESRLKGVRWDLL